MTSRKCCYCYKVTSRKCCYGYKVRWNTTPKAYTCQKNYNFYLVIAAVPDQVYVFYAYRLYFADKDIYMIRYCCYHKIEIIKSPWP